MRVLSLLHDILVAIAIVGAFVIAGGVTLIIYAMMM